MRNVEGRWPTGNEFNTPKRGRSALYSEAAVNNDDDCEIIENKC
jgi:hypothetical protein